MTNKTEWEGHTPLPWRIEEGTDLIWGACNPDDRSTYGMGYSIVEGKTTSLWIKSPDWAEREANAALIVHCVNNFPALEAERDALRAVLKSLARWFDADDEVLDAMSQDELADHNRQVDKISKALAISEKSE